MNIATLLCLFQLFLLAVCQPAAAQRYLPATITFHSGRTESGAVYHGNWVETPQTFRYMNKSGVEQKYGVEEVRSVEVRRKDGKTERFECRIVLVNRSPVRVADLETGAAPRMEKDTVFLQTLLLSEVNLYLFKDAEAKHFFTEKDSLQELVFKQYLREPNDPVLMKNNRFRQQLIALTIDCPYLKEFILKISYNEKSIRNILLEYNKCKKTAIAYQYKPEKLKIHFFAGGGATIASLRAIQVEEPLEPLEVIEKDPTIRLTPVAGFLFPIPRTNNRFSVKTDLSLRSIEYAYGYEMTPPGYSSALETIKITHLRSHALLQWNIVNRKHILFILGGVHNSWVIGNESELTFSNGFETSERDYEFGLVAGAGYGFNRIDLDIRYDRGKGYSTNGAINSFIQTVSIFLYYRLF